MLADWYKAHAAAKSVEVVYVPSDRSQAEYDDYLSEMPWPALPLADAPTTHKLMELCGVKGLPMLVLLNKAGAVVATDARGKVVTDPEGFPWP